jgi:hypothetical protein
VERSEAAQTERTVAEYPVLVGLADGYGQAAEEPLWFGD